MKMNNKKATKRALLTSVMALAMCVVMLIGTTFAWFTDTATANVNTIKSGTLDVALEMFDTTQNKWVNAEGKTLNWVRPANATGDILWEPGCTYELPQLRVINNGSLALKYKVQITGIKTNHTPVAGTFDLNDVIEWTINGLALDTATSLAPNAISQFTIKGHMKEEAGNDYQDLTLDSVSITVLATQDTVEYDSTRKTYDEDAEYPNVVVVTPGTLADVNFNQSNVVYNFVAGDYTGKVINGKRNPDTVTNAVYHFGAGNYTGVEIRVGKDNNTTFEADDGAVFDKLTIAYQVAATGNTDKTASTMTVKGFHVNDVLSIRAVDGTILVEDNKAAKITVFMERGDAKDNATIQIKNNELNGGDYGVFVTPNHNNYNLSITGNTFTNIQSHAISVMGNVGELPPTEVIPTTAGSITVTGNNFVSYGTVKTNRAAFKIWEDTKFAPNTDKTTLTADASALGESIKTNNTFSDAVRNNHMAAQFYSASVTF